MHVCVHVCVCVYTCAHAAVTTPGRAQPLALSPQPSPCGEVLPRARVSTLRAAVGTAQGPRGYETLSPAVRGGQKDEKSERTPREAGLGEGRER